MAALGRRRRAQGPRRPRLGRARPGEGRGGRGGEGGAVRCPSVGGPLSPVGPSRSTARSTRSSPGAFKRRQQDGWVGVGWKFPWKGGGLLLRSVCLTYSILCVSAMHRYFPVQEELASRPPTSPRTRASVAMIADGDGLEALRVRHLESMMECMNTWRIFRRKTISGLVPHGVVEWSWEARRPWTRLPTHLSRILVLCGGFLGGCGLNGPTQILTCPLPFPPPVVNRTSASARSALRPSWPAPGRRRPRALAGLSADCCGTPRPSRRRR
jgi:hypothetical protein